jgi:hypothetical protein
MKWYHWVAIAIALIWLWPKKTVSPKTVANTGKTPEQLLIEEANANWPGGAGDPSKIHLADQEKYPGFYVNGADPPGYFNPETGESYSPGSSPVSYASTAYTRGEIEYPRPDITSDAQAGRSVLTASGEETAAAGYDMVY